MSTENSTSCTKPFLWESILIATLFSLLYLVGLIMIYIKLWKIDKKTAVHKARRQPGLRTKKPNHTQEAGQEFDPPKMPASQPLWLRDQIQSQLAQHPSIQINSCTPKGSCSELSSHSDQHSDSDDVNYTTLSFPVPKHGISTVRGYRD